MKVTFLTFLTFGQPAESYFYTKGEHCAAISLPWCEPKRAVVCNQSSHYAKTLKVSTALQSVFLGTNLNGRWYAISLPTLLRS